MIEINFNPFLQNNLLKTQSENALFGKMIGDESTVRCLIEKINSLIDSFEEQGLFVHT